MKAYFQKSLRTFKRLWNHILPMSLILLESKYSLVIVIVILNDLLQSWETLERKIAIGNNWKTGWPTHIPKIVVQTWEMMAQTTQALGIKENRCYEKLTPLWSLAEEGSSRQTSLCIKGESKKQWTMKHKRCILMGTYYANTSMNALRVPYMVVSWCRDWSEES